MSPAPKRPFYSAYWGDPSTTELRRVFLCAVDEVAPELASEMVKIVGSVFQSLADLSTNGDPLAFARIAKDEEELVAAFNDWAHQYGLDRDQWIFDHALLVIALFLKNPELQPGFGAVLLLAAYEDPTTSYGAPGRQISPPGPYRPDLQTRRDYMDQVGSYADLVEETARSLGWEPVTWKPNAKIHLEWLARFQVNGELVASISLHHDPGNARAKSKQVRTIERALKGMADLIGLTRRTLT